MYERKHETQPEKPETDYLRALMYNMRLSIMNFGEECPVQVCGVKREKEQTKNAEETRGGIFNGPLVWRLRRKVFLRNV